MSPAKRLGMTLLIRIQRTEVKRLKRRTKRTTTSSICRSICHRASLTAGNNITDNCHFYVIYQGLHLKGFSLKTQNEVQHKQLKHICQKVEYLTKESRMVYAKLSSANFFGKQTLGNKIPFSSITIPTSNVQVKLQHSLNDRYIHYVTFPSYE